MRGLIDQITAPGNACSMFGNSDDVCGIPPKIQKLIYIESKVPQNAVQSASGLLLDRDLAKMELKRGMAQLCGLLI